MQPDSHAAEKKEGASAVSFETGQGGLPLVKIQTRWSEAQIYLHGAHVTHFQKKNEPPLLFMSEKSLFSANNPIRGGIPIVFPWFGPKEGGPSHGFARTAVWILTRIETNAGGEIIVHLQLPEDAGGGVSTPTLVEYIVTVGENLQLELRVENYSIDVPFTFEECLHTYFAIGDINEVSVAGLKGTKYLDKVGGSVEKTEFDNEIKVTSEVDRVYQDTTATVEIRDAKLHRKIVVSKENSSATVVWNPWIAKSKAMADFGDEEYHKMICVESGNVGKNKSTVEPKKTVSMKVTVSSSAL